MTDAESGTVIENTYDAVGNKTKETEKDKNGKLNYAVDTAGNRTTYSYDKGWRVKTIVSDTAMMSLETWFPLPIRAVRP